MHQGLFWHRCFPRSQLELQRDGHTPVRERRGCAPRWLFGWGALAHCGTTHHCHGAEERGGGGAVQGGMSLLKNCQGRQVRVIRPACHPSQAKVCAPARGGARQGCHLCAHSLIRSHQPLGADTCLCLIPSPSSVWMRAAPVPRGYFSLQQRCLPFPLPALLGFGPLGGATGEQHVLLGPRAHPHCRALCLCFGLGSRRSKVRGPSQPLLPQLCASPAQVYVLAPHLP